MGSVGGEWEMGDEVKCVERMRELLGGGYTLW